MAFQRKYVWMRKGKWTKPHSALRLRLAASARIIWGGGPYKIFQDGDEVGKDLSKTKAVSRFMDMTTHREVGSVFRVRGKHGRLRISGRAVLVNVLPTDSTNGNSKADAYYNWILTHYKQFHPSYAGSYVCKHIAGTWTLSQHSYGNAVDFFFDSSTHQSLVAQAVVNNATQLRAYHVISHSSVWTKGEGWRPYTGEYHSHLHVDFDPQISGGCGVRG